MAKKNVKIIRYLNTGIFPATVLFSVGFKYDELVKKISKHGDWAKALHDDKEFIDGSNYCALVRTVKNKKGKEVKCFFIVITSQFTFTDSEMCNLAHEVLHACQFILRDMLDMEREIEAVAYTHTHIMTQCLQELREANK